MIPASNTPGEPQGDARYRISQDAVATIVIFGATGDLASRKLLPAIYNLWRSGFLPEKLAVVGVARKPKSDNEFRAEMCDALKKYSRTGSGDSDSCDPFVSNLFYHQLDFGNDQIFAPLASRLQDLERSRSLPGNRLYYLAVSPEHFAPIVERLGEADMAPHGENGGPWARVVIEKPFGVDLDSARALNARLSSVLTEDQIFRIDHYLGKETVQNIFAFRLANAVFEPLFNNRYVDHVQITVAETVGMEGRRGAFYDHTGALRDVVQNHVFQLMCLVAMEPPAKFNAKEIHDEKVKVLRSVSLPKDQDLRSWCIRAQYAEGRNVPGYLSEEGVAEDSSTETFVALKLHVDNWRWAGVPFLVRSGKRLKERVTEIAVQFNQPPRHQFRGLGLNPPEANTLVFRIQPDEAIKLTFNGKPPGMSFQVQNMTMDFSYGTAFHEQLPEAYERLLLDALRGDSTLFMRADEIETAWEICTEILNLWKTAPPPELYRPGTWGPSEAERLMEGCQGGWREPEP